MNSSTKWIIGGAAALVVINMLSKSAGATSSNSFASNLGSGIGNTIGETSASTIWNIPASFFNWFENKGEELGSEFRNVIGNDFTFGVGI